MTQRATSVQEIFDNMAGRLAPEKLGDLRATIQFDLSGEGGGQWYLEIADRKAQITQGKAANPTMTMHMAAADYLAMINGDLNAMQAFMQGKIKIQGDMSLAMKMQSWLA